MSFRRSSKIAPISDEFSLDFLEDLNLDPSATDASSALSNSQSHQQHQDVLFSSTAPASLGSVHRTGEDIYADILGLENSLASSGINTTNDIDDNNNNKDDVSTPVIASEEGTHILSQSSYTETNEISNEISKHIFNSSQLNKPIENKSEETEKNGIHIDNDIDDCDIESGVGVGGSGSGGGGGEKVKGVSAGVMYVNGLMDSLNKNNSMIIQFPCAPLARVSDINRIASELSFGIYIARAFPWVSIESTHDRGAARVVALHPCYRNTLTGLVFTEIDIALKAVGGTAKGGLFLSTSDREKFLNKECLCRDWGPNGQKRPPNHLRDVQNIQKQYPSFTLSDEIFKSNEVSQWRQEWEGVWSGDTGMDIQGKLNKLELVNGQEGSNGDGSGVETVLVHSDWAVAIHDDGSVGEQIKAVRIKGEELCKKLLPTVPIPVPMSVGKASGVNSECEDIWLPPEDTRLAYLFELLKVITGLATIFESARADHPTLVPSTLSSTMVENHLRNNSHHTNMSDGFDSLKCNTPTHIPFEPSIDRETNSLFLGGGVGICAAPSNVLKRKRRLPSTPPSPCINISWHPYQPSSSSSSLSKGLSQRAMEQAQTRLASLSSLFYHEVVSFGLWGNYSSSHTWLSHPKNSPSQMIDSETLAARIDYILPDGYSRRLKKSCYNILANELGRKDAAEVYRTKKTLTGGADQITSNEEIITNKKKPKNVKDEENEEGLDIVEAVALFNGDSYAGGWRLGRRHGKGIYKFASGSRYEGEWKEGEMVGWGIYIMEDGTRRNIRHK